MTRQTLNPCVFIFSKGLIIRVDNTCGKALAVAGDWLHVPAAGTFLLRSIPEIVDPVTGGSTASGNLSIITEVFDAGGSAGANPFTSTGGEGS